MLILVKWLFIKKKKYIMNNNVEEINSNKEIKNKRV